MAVLTEPAAEPVVASAPMPAPDAIVARRRAPIAPHRRATAAARRAPAAALAHQAPHRPAPVPVRPRPGRALGRRRRRGGPRLPGRPARRRRRALRRRGPRRARGPRADRAQRLQAARRRGARGALPGRHAHRRQGRRRLALRARHRRLRAAHARTSPRCATRSLRVARPGCLCLVDGFAVPDFGHEQRAIVDGDATSAAIAAASIVAKVTRDRFMHRADALPPGLGVPLARRLLDARAPRRDPAPGRLAAAPAVLPEHGLPAARALEPSAIRTPPRGGRGARAGRARR